MVKKDTQAYGAKKNAHFNVIDAVIIILIIAVLLSIYFRFNVIDSLWAKTQTKEYEVSFTIDDIRYTTPSYIDIGDEVYFADSGEYFGKLISESENKNALSITPASEYFTDSQGNVVEVFYPDGETRVNARGRLVCEGYYTEDGGFSVGGKQYLASGQTLKLRTELVTVTVKITSIEPSAEE